jgi:hypothetical protein
MDYENRYALFIQIMGGIFGLQMINAAIVLIVIMSLGQKSLRDLNDENQKLAITLTLNKIQRWLMRYFSAALILIVIVAMILNAIYF